MTLVIPRPRPLRRGDAFVLGGTFCAVEALTARCALIVSEDGQGRYVVPRDLVAVGRKQAEPYQVSAEEVAAWPFCPACRENALLPGWKVCGPCREPVESQEAT